MQKEACRNFAESQGWEIIKEFPEKGVSGFKKSAKDRDELQKIQQAAMEGKFDILLVFIFDRLGRRDDETPFIVEWFTKQGIEVWSVNEGQQRFDTHVDKLMNYIRYWQASGESLKTSVRTRTRLEQLTGEGHYTGGTVAFGYKRVRLGRVNKKNQEVCDLVIDEAEAEIVRLIFHKYVYEGYGAQKLSHYANRTLSQQYRFCAHLMHCEKRKINVYGLHINWGNTDRETLINAAIAAVDDDMAFCDVLRQCVETKN